MPQIADKYLTEPRNSFLLAYRDEGLFEVLKRLKQEGGQNWWHLIVVWGMNDYRAICFADLADQLRAIPQGLDWRLEDLNLPSAVAVQKASVGIGVARELARRQTTKLIVVTEKASVVGLLYEGNARSSGVGFSVFDYLNEGEGAAFIKKSQPQPTNLFRAFPEVGAPRRVSPRETFVATVGFSNAPAELQNQPVEITNPPVGAKCLVILDGEGVDLLDGDHRVMPLDLQAKATFTCQAKSNANKATLTAKYFYDCQLVGLVNQEIEVGEGSSQINTAVPEATSRCRVTSPPPESYTDLQILVTYSSTGGLSWRFLARRPYINLGPIDTNYQGAREFAADLIKELQTQQHAGPFAAQILENRGEKIADLMPREFFDVVGHVHAAVKRLPTILLITQETYIPWELALLDDPLDPTQPHFLGAQTLFGRWIYHDKVMFPPPTAIEVKRFTAVSAEYGPGTGLQRLAEAAAEGRALCERFGAVALKATLADLATVLEKTEGHLIHFAVHGLNNPEANEQVLLLADKSRLTSGGLIGRHRCGQTPRFAFVFLNACQVGSGGSSLGQAAGFPGDLVRGGASGFIAPLWEIHDVPARELAEAFYESVLNDQVTVAEFLREQRTRYSQDDTMTPLAYIFYGHPMLRLHFSK